MNWQSATKNAAGEVTIPGRWIDLHYYEALNILFRVENAIRLIVYVTLKNQHFDNWTTINVVGDDSENGSIGSLAKKRRSQAGTYAYLGYPISSPLMYLTMGELMRLIVSESGWKVFKKWFRGSKNVVEMKLEEILAVRNALAHFRPIRPDD